MFGLSRWAGVGNLESLLDRERNPPARPTPLDFPSYLPPYRPRGLTSEDSARLQHKLCHTRALSDISDDDLAALNIKYETDVPLSEFAPSGFLTVRPFPYDGMLEEVLAEISVNNDDAFREVLRMEPLPERQKAHLQLSRAFFGNLEDMTRYWNTSRDEYYRVPAEKDASHSTPVTTGGSTQQELPPSAISTSSATSQGTQDGENVDALGTTNSEPKPNTTTTSPSRPSDGSTKEVYKGYRLGNGEDMSSGVRIAMARNFLKMVIHKFHCRDHEPVPAPREKFIFRGVKLQSIQYLFCVARVPQATKAARARLVEGPLMAVHVREEIHFASSEKRKVTGEVPAAVAEDGNRNGDRNEDDGKDNSGGPHDVDTDTATATTTRRGTLASGASSSIDARFDLLREIGCMLILAAQRAREGKSNAALAGEDRWWVANRRWGGGPTKWGQLASEVYEDEDPSWSPEEKRIQEQKKKADAVERLRANAQPGTGANPASRLQLDDLIANTSTKTKTSASSANVSASASALPSTSTFATPSSSGSTPTPAAATGGIGSVGGGLRGDATGHASGSGNAGPKQHWQALQYSQPRKKMRSFGPPAGKEDDPSYFRNGRRLMFTPAFRKKWFENWKELRPNRSSWDEKIIYKQIGRDVSSPSSSSCRPRNDPAKSPATKRPQLTGVETEGPIEQVDDDGDGGPDDGDDGFDDVYMLGAVNHHICLYKMRVHRDYLGWVETGKAVPDDGSDEVSAEEEKKDDTEDQDKSDSLGKDKGKKWKKNILYVSRSPYLDMFDVDSRRELVIALWRVMSWLNRDYLPKEEFR